jgi:signal transduction histidine kinase
MHDVICTRCAACEVHKKTVVVTVLITEADGTVKKFTRTLTTMMADLLALDEWLRSVEIVQIAQIGTGVYRHPVYNVLEEGLRQFNEVIASLEQSNYTVQLRSVGIREFDEVFMRFNDLINRLRHEEKLRKDLVSDISHELNMPLTIMIGQLAAIQD